MKYTEEDVLLRIFIGETEHYKGKALYEAIVHKARESGLAGATVLRGVLGFGADRRMHSAKILDLTDNLPVVVEIVDREEKINGFLPFLDDIIHKGFVTMEKVHVIKYR